MSLVWYTGITLNGLLVISFAHFIVLLLKDISLEHRREQKQKRIVVTFSLVSTMSVNLSLLLIYLQMGIIQQDIFIDETLWPILFIAGYHLSLLSISILMWLQYYSQRKSLLIFILCQAIVSLSTLILSSDYIIFWNDGAVLVALGPISDTITLWLGLVVGIVFLYLALVYRLEEISENKQQNTSSNAGKLLLVALINFAQFLIPRTEVGSIVDPFSVKFIGFLVTIGFGYALFRYARREDSLTEAMSEEEGKQFVGPSLKQLSIAVIIAVLFILAVQNQPDYGTGIEWREFLQSQSLFIGHWFNMNYYLNIFAVVIPLVCFIISLITINIVPKYKQVFWNKKAYAWILLTGILQVGLFLIVHLPYLQINAIPDTGGLIIMPLIISPVVAGLILELISKDNGHTSFFLATQKKVLIARIVYIFGVTFIAGLFVDVMLTLPPFSQPMNHVFIGAAGLLDGLLWAPIMAVVVYEIIRSLGEIL